ncbi:50S ribosomal protein L9 [Candidatus Parcubacteria bacterium]|nr:50S ribosomal protein L9 [Candidatus Parcubacteria bacterium]
MKIILLRDIKGVGKKYEEKQVSDGYAINSLLPKKLAVPATGAVAGQIKSLKENESRHEEALVKKLHEEVYKLTGKEIKIVEKANEKNHLFRALSRDKIAELLKKENINIPEEFIVLENPIRDLGTFTIPIKIDGKETHFKLIVESK